MFFKNCRSVWIFKGLQKVPLKSPHLCKGLSPMWDNLMLCLLPQRLLCVGIEKQKIAKNN
jgi:hypothetical protein